MGWGKIVYKGSNVTPEGENIGSTVGKYVSGDKVFVESVLGEPRDIF